MGWNIWFVPSNSSHIGKNRLLLEALQERGCRIRMLCLDEVVPAKDRTREQMEQGDFEFEILPANGFDAGRHWILQGPQRKHLVRSYTEVFKTWRGDAVILGADARLVSRTAGDVARGLGIPTILVLDGLVAPCNPCYRPGLLTRAYNRTALAIGSALGSYVQSRASPVDLLLVMNQLSRSLLTKQGIDARRIRVVGSPEYDALARQIRDPQPAEVKRDVRARLGLPPDRPLVLFAHQDLGRPRLTHDSIAAMVKAARAEDATVLVKLHPRSEQTPEALRAWSQNQGFGKDELVITSTECTSIEAVRICSVCVTFFSTVSIEAMVCGRPVIFMLYHGSPLALSAEHFHGAALDATSPGGLETQIARVLSEPMLRHELVQKATAALEQELYGLDGRSVERGVEAILELIAVRSASGSLTYH